jgi:hypothetical protein
MRNGLSTRADKLSFRHVGSEALWGDALQLQEAIAGAKNGGIGGRCEPAFLVGRDCSHTAEFPRDLRGMFPKPTHNKALAPRLQRLYRGASEPVARLPMLLERL